MFAPPRPARPTDPTPRPVHRPSTPLPASTANIPAVSRTDTDTELALRRQLSRLQHQLAEAQRELAHKDEELAAAVEKRVQLQTAYDAVITQDRRIQQELDAVDDFRARMAGVEHRLQQAVAKADELTHQLERERTERAAIAVQFDEANAAFERARNLWRDESALVGEQHAAQLAQVEHQKRTAVEAAEAAMNASLERMREAHQAELEKLREAHVRSLAALRGELVPQVMQARTYTEEIERLNSQLAAQATEHQNLLAERVELHKWELAQQAEAHAAELAARQRTHAAEVARMSEEVEAANEAGRLIDRNAKAREQLWEQTVATLRESQKKLQQELAEAKERSAQTDANTWSVEQRLVTALQATERLDEEIRALREKLDAAEQDARRNALERQRFAAYLEEGLAMLGAPPPPLQPEFVPDPPPLESTRSTRNYGVPDFDDEPDHEPTRP